MKIKNVLLSSKFKRSFAKLSPDIQLETLKKKSIFQKNPFSPQLKTHKLKGKHSNKWSFSITWSYRIVFVFKSDKEVLFYDIGDH